MRIACLVAFTGWALWSPAAHAQTPDPAEVQHWDVVYTTDGSIWKGLIIEQVPGKFYRVALSGGSVVTVDAEKVQRIAKEPNPGYAAAHAPTLATIPVAMASPTSAASAPTATVHREPESQPARSRWIEPGPRFSLAPGVAVPTGDFGEGSAIGVSPLVTLRIGGELITGLVGITPAFRADYIYWVLDTEALGITTDIAYHFLHVGADVRVALRTPRLRRLAPYVSLGVGADLSMIKAEMSDAIDGKGFGLGIGFGTDVLLSPGFALGLALNLHPGFAEYAEGAEVNVSYFGVGLALATY